MAKELGYIDEYDVDYFQAMRALCKAANIDPDKPYQVMEIIEEKSFFEKIISNSQHAIKSLKMVHEIDIKSDSANKLQGKPSYILPQR